MSHQQSRGHHGTHPQPPHQQAGRQSAQQQRPTAQTNQRGQSQQPNTQRAPKVRNGGTALQHQMNLSPLYSSNLSASRRTPQHDSKHDTKTPDGKGHATGRVPTPSTAPSTSAAPAPSAAPSSSAPNHQRDSSASSQTSSANSIDGIMEASEVQQEYFASERHLYMLEPVVPYSMSFPAAQVPQHGSDGTGSATPQAASTITGWRLKERCRTVAAALVMCLNVGVDPPDVVKPNVCARLEAWIDPFSMPADKALLAIGSALKRNYERWQPRARYKVALDPTLDEIKKHCLWLRRAAKHERALFHYNGHGVPRPSQNGEIWVFNQNYTQYIPLSIYELQNWLGTPTIFVFDCSAAGVIVDAYLHFLNQRKQEAAQQAAMQAAGDTRNRGLHRVGRANRLVGSVGTSVRDNILLAACGANELLPMSPEYPADLFTSCFTTPIKVALRW
jgi:Raptor N-terminal CASPase like domain